MLNPKPQDSMATLEAPHPSCFATGEASGGAASLEHLCRGVDMGVSEN